MKIYKPAEANDDVANPKSYLICQKSLKGMTKKDLRRVVTIAQAVTQETNRLRNEVNVLCRRWNQPVNRMQPSQGTLLQSEFNRSAACTSNPNNINRSSLKVDFRKVYAVRRDLEEFGRFQIELKKILLKQGIGVLSRPILRSARRRLKKARKMRSRSKARV